MESNNKSVESKHALVVRMGEHESIRAQFVDEAKAVRFDPSRAPELPILVHIEEALAAVRAATQCKEALAAVGMPEDLPRMLERYIAGLRSAEVLWQAVRRGGRGGELERLLASGREVRGYVHAAALLALRKHLEGLRRVEAIVPGEEARDVSSNLVDLGLVVTQFATEFGAIRVDVEATATRLGELAARIEEAAAADEDGAQALALARAKDLRDRIYALSLEPLAEIRAFASFAFRDDESPARRLQFSSRYIREKARRMARRVKAVRNESPAANDAPATEEANEKVA